MQVPEQVVTCQLHTTSHKKKTTILRANIFKKKLTWYRTTIANILNECKDKKSKSHHHQQTLSKA
jgi:hypothetical protein